VRHELLFGDFDYLASFVTAAVGAGAMGKFRFVTIGTLGASRGAERIVRAAAGGAALGVSSFGIWHR
jgi:hypothetical protein